MSKLRELQDKLAYWQTQARLEARWLAETNAKCEEIQAEIDQLSPPMRTDRPKQDEWTGQGEQIGFEIGACNSG